jgi:hypothetical protein
MLHSSFYKKANAALLPSEVTTRIGIFLGLDFTTTQTLELNSNKYLSSIPSFSFSSDFTKVIIDYSNSENQTDVSLLKGLFSGLTAGHTFTIKDASYYIDGSQSVADLGGTYAFKNFVGNVIVAEPISVNNFNSRLYRYESPYFTTAPQFGLSLSPKGIQTEYTITNALGTDKVASFAKFGIYPEDKLKITGTAFNNSTFTVKSVKVNKDGTENIVVKEGFTLESAFGNRVGLELIQQKKGISTIVAATGPVDTGACGVYKNGVLVACYEDQTIDQCVARTSFTGGTPFTWRANLRCNSLPSSISTPTTGGFVSTTATTNVFASLNNLGYFNSFNSVNT